MLEPAERSLEILMCNIKALALTVQKLLARFKFTTEIHDNYFLSIAERHYPSYEQTFPKKAYAKFG